MDDTNKPTDCGDVFKPLTPSECAVKVGRALLVQDSPAARRAALHAKYVADGNVAYLVQTNEDCRPCDTEDGA